MTTTPPASVRQITDWLRSLPATRKGVLSRLIVCEWAGVDDRHIRRVLKGEKPLGDTAQYRLSKLMREFNDGGIVVRVLPDGGAMIERVKPTEPIEGGQPVPRPTIDTSGAEPRIRWGF